MSGLLRPRSGQAADRNRPFTRRDALRLVAVTGLLVVALGAILSFDMVPAQLGLRAGSPAPETVRAPRTIDFQSDIETAAARAAAAAAVDPQYDYTTDQAAGIADQQVAALRTALAPIDVAFGPTVTPTARKQALDAALPSLSSASRAVLESLTPDEWTTVRNEALRVLDQVERTELRDSAMSGLSARVSGQLSASLSDPERSLATELVVSELVPNSSFSALLTQQAKDRAAQAVAPVHYTIAKGEVIVDQGHVVTDVMLAQIHDLGLDANTFDVALLAGWILLVTLVVSLFLAWVWRFRQALWHRNNALLLLGFILVVTTLALKLGAGRPLVPYLIPTAAAGLLTAILLDASLATVLIAIIALVTGVVNGNSLELTTFVFLGGFAGLIAVRRGDRLQYFFQAGLAIFLVDAIVVSVFGLLGEHDVTGVLQLVAASAGAAGGAAVAAVGTFAVLGDLFGILTVFRLQELASPSQPILRRLLTETPGTYHHSLMVGNLAERAATAVGADPLITRVAAYYHDIGKLANPLAFIENQAGNENIHDELEPEVSAQVLKQHIPDGIELAYKSHLPKSLIAFIPQHHGTALISFFYGKARDEAAAAAGGSETAAGRAAADAIDERRYRHAGPKPQSKEAALIMLADGVEASVRSLSSRDEATIRAMVNRIVDERVSDGQLDECDLTIRDLERIREAFVQQLLGMYHQRIAYPQNKIVELESRRDAHAG